MNDLENRFQKSLDRTIAGRLKTFFPEVAQ